MDPGSDPQEQSAQSCSEQLSEEGRSAPQYDQKDATIYGFSPESQGNAIVSGEKVESNTVIGTQNAFNAPVGAVGNQGTIGNVAEIIEGDQIAYQEVHQYFPQLSKTEPTGIPHNLPRSGAQFVGREQEIETLHQQLQRSDRIAISAIAGMGGIGKTELALQYAVSHLQQGTYSGGLCWLQARGADLGSQVVSFARTKLGLTLPDGLELVEQVDFCWGHWRNGEVLIVFDDVTDYEVVEPYLPPSDLRFKVLFTTRLRMSKTVKELCLEVLSEAAAIELLGRLAGVERIQGQLEDAKALCSWLGYLPLGLELVGRYLDRKPDLSLAKMQQRLETKRLEAQALAKAEAGMTANWGVAAAFELSWQELSHPAQLLGCLLSLFALAPIPWSLVESVAEQLSDEAVILSDIEELEDLRDGVLLKVHLLQRMGEGTYQLHQLIREFFITKREQLEEKDSLKQDYCRTMVKVNKTISQKPTLDEIAAIASSIPHLEEVATAFRNWLSDEDLDYSFILIARFWEGQGAYAQAEPWYKQCLTAVQEKLGTDHPSTAIALDNLAGLYRSQGRYEEAEPLCLRALEIIQHQLGTDHPDTAIVLDNLAGLYVSQGRYEEAEPLFIRALNITQHQLGDDHPSTATNLNNLAALYESQGRYEEAESFLIRALKINQQRWGEDNLYIATILNNLAALYRLQKRYGEAETLYLKALEIIQHLLGADHPDTAQGLNNLALLYTSQERYGEAETLYLKALEITQHQFGTDYPLTATSLNNLAELYRLQGRYGDAEPLYFQALEIKKRRLGVNHPSIANSLSNLALLYHSQGRYGDAETLYREALPIFKQRLGAQHSKTIGCIDSIEMLRKQRAEYLSKQSQDKAKQKNRSKNKMQKQARRKNRSKKK